MPTLARLTGPTAMLGGLLLVVACFVQNSLPQGCIGVCEDGRSMREATTAGTMLFALSGLLLALSAVGMLLLARAARGLGRTGVIAAVAGGCGCALLGAAGVVAGFLDPDWGGMPGLVVPGVGLIVVGVVLLGWVILRARVLPVQASVFLLVATLVLPFANEQTSRILLALPFAAAWFVAGAVLWGAPARVGRRRGAVAS